MALPQGDLKGSQNSTDSLWPDTPANFGLKRKLSGTRQEHQNDAFVGKPLKKETPAKYPQNEHFERTIFDGSSGV